MKVDLAPWRPDVSHLNDAYASDVQNVLLGAGRYIPFPSLAAFTEAVGEQPLGGIAARVSGAVHIFVGSATMLWKLDVTTSTWLPVSTPGADTILTGNFAADTNWTKDALWTISAGVAHATAVANGNGLSQVQALTAGKIYKLVFTVSGYSAGAVLPMFTGGTQVDGDAVTADGTYTQYLTAVTGNTALEFQAVGTTTLNIDNVSLKQMGIYGASVDERWRFRQYGSYVVAVNINDDPQYYEIGVSTEFVDLPGSPPHARNLAVWGDRLALFVGPTAYWSDTDDIGEWVAGTAGSQTFPDGGDIMFSTDMTNPIIVQERAIRAGTFVPGSLAAFTFTKVHDAKGCVSPYAGASRGNLAFFADAGAFWQIDGAGALTPIGFEKVDRTIFARLVEKDAVYCEVDPRFQRVYFAVQINSTVAGVYDRLLIYDWQIGEWTQVDIDVGILFPLAAGTTGLTLDDDAPGDVLLEDQGDVSLDSSIYQGGAPLMAAFLDDFTMGFFDGPALEATVTTQEAGSTDGTMMRVADIMPIVDTAQVRISIGSRNRRGDAVMYSAEGTPSTRTGICKMKSRARFHRIRMRIEAGAAWTAAQAVNISTAPAGSQ